MAFINNKVTCFHPSLKIEQTAAALQEKIVDDISAGDVELTPDTGFGGFSKVTIKGARYTASGLMYAEIMRFKTATGGLYNEALELKKAIICAGVDAYAIPSFADCPMLETVIFEDGCNCVWQNPAFTGSTKVPYMCFKNVDADFYIDIWGSATESLTELTEVEVCEGWSKDLAFYVSPLTADCMITMINNLATVTEGQTLWLGDENLAKLEQEQIDVAVNKGWDVF